MDTFTFTLILIIISLLGYILWMKIAKNYEFFNKQNIKFKKSIPLFGNNIFLNTIKGECIVTLIQENYAQFPGEKFIGMFDFFTPVLFIKDPEVIKQLTIKDFGHFQDHRTFTDPEAKDVFANILFFMKGKQWRDMRSSLTPLFTGSKMRSMLQLINKCTQQTVDFITADHAQNGPIPYHIKNLFNKYATDVTATCAFGVECDSFKNPDNEFYLLGKKIMEIQKPSKMLQFVFIRVLPKLMNLLGVKFMDQAVLDVFKKLIIDNMEFRKKEGIVRLDMIQLLMKLRDGQKLNVQDDEKLDIEAENKLLKSEGKRSWTDNEIIAQSFLFFVAGLDALTTTMTFAAYELALNPDVQNKLIEEIDETQEKLNGGPLTYEILQKMKYMDMVISEVLRKWPSVVMLDRECVKNYSYKDDDGLNITIEKGTMLMIPTFAIQRDPKYYPNPDKFDPERFNEENKQNINMNAFLSFGIGPRSCIGNRFALMEMKALFYHLLLNFRIKPSESTQIPLKLKKRIFALIPEKDIELLFEPRDKKKIN